jgi:UDP-2,3-diacylglucosamine pyrophosphatase LpxH
MLAIISDLHFTDGTTSNWGTDPRASGGRRDLFNVSPKAFKLFFTDLAEIVARGNGIRKVKVVYAGDIFDLLRTVAWFDAPPSAVPWSVPLDPTKLEIACGEILDRIVANNEKSLAWLSGAEAQNDTGALVPFAEFEAIWPKGVALERVYLPGNHDRLVNLFPSLRARVWKRLLGRDGEAGEFANQYRDGEGHAAFVMHGHESDPFNCEFRGDGRPDYAAIPIGDPMTTCLFTRLGHEAERCGMPPEVVRRLRDIDNVRPTLASIRFVQETISRARVEKEMGPLIDRVVSEFQGLEFYKRWHKAHDRWNVGLDEADKLALALRAIKLLGTRFPAGMIEKLSGLASDDSCQALALKCLGNPVAVVEQYCVLGHTHEPAHTPLTVDDSGVQKHYLNSGTFRATLTKAFSGDDFVEFQRMSYVLVYGPEEFQAGEQRPMYEMWSGLRRHN